ncbi:MAG: uracil-DNA glycosylase [Thermoplasmatota archaeon]
MSKESELNEVRKRIISCRKCDLSKTRHHSVAGEGSSNASIMFIGEAPGFHEDKKGQPFVGRAGKILDELLASVDLNRSDVFIANILKCRPPNNRNPKKDEILACTEYLDRQIEIIQPSILVPLGNFACAYIFEKFGISYTKISRIHGKTFQRNTLLGSLYIIPMYHPAVATYNSQKKSTLLTDMESLQSIEKELIVKKPS